MKTKQMILISAAIIGTLLSSAQGSESPLLEKLVTIELRNEPVRRALERIENLGGFSFSYNPATIDPDRKITHHFKSRPLREVLDVIFEGKVAYREKGRYIILQRIKDGYQQGESVKQVYITGYVEDQASGERITSATVYERTTLGAANTDAYGFFKMKVVKPGDRLEIAAFKTGYSDTLVVLSELPSTPVFIKLQKLEITDRYPAVKPELAKRDTIVNPVAGTVSDLKPGVLASTNVSDTVRKAFSISFLPFLGSNGLISGRVINEYSLNVIGGYSMGNEKLEVGGVFNVNEGNTSGVQAAGVFNANGGTSEGVKLAGVFNATGNDFTGVAAAGVFNYFHTSGSGVSVAGVFNHINGYMDGVQVAGVFNSAPCGIGKGQVAGVINFSAEETRGAQVAGVINTSLGKVHGAQIAGIINAAEDSVTGSQVAGVINVNLREVQGAQVASVINVAGKVRGSQVAMINICDTIQGVPVGLFSYVHSGYHHVEAYADETFIINMSLRTGVRSFYNIIGAGINPGNTEKQTWYYAYGVGGSPRISNKVNLDLQLTGHWINRDGPPDFNMLNKFLVGADWRISKNVSFAAGFHLNGLITERTNTWPETIIPGEGWVWHDQNLNADYNLKIFPGARAGVRIWW